MTSEIEALKTNEFMRRRKLRLQQVREQSNDIAKKIRQRAKVEKLRQVVNLDVKKQKEYLQRQGELVKKLGDLYSKRIDNIGASHRSASELNEQAEVPKVDVSKLRGREAAAALRKEKQEKLNEQKKLLDRKLQAREAANEISREKSTAIANKAANKIGENQDKATGAQEEGPNNTEKHTEIADDQNKPVTNDMATQWDSGVEPEWEPNIPSLSLPKDDSPKDNIESRSDKTKRLDLFALSEEMPSSLRGGITNIEERAPNKPALTLVSEYLQNRALRLRETSTAAPTKKTSEDLLSIKETILRTRTSKLEGTPLNACCVLDEQLIPVPSWRAEQHCGFCSHSVSYHNSKKKHFNVTNSQINKMFSSVRPVHRDLSPVQTYNEANFRRNRVFERNFKGSNTEKSSRSSAIDSGARRNAVTMYNHSTRNTKDILRGDERLVVRDEPNVDDAYSQARREASIDTFHRDHNQKDHQKKIQEMRHKVAMTKQNVEKEYKDTINFLNSLPNDNGKPIRKAYMDEHRQQMQKDNREHKLQQEYKKIEKECRKHSCTKSRNKSKSPVKIMDDEYNNRDFQYSWMPVPESDGSLAIHTIPTTVKEGKSGNTVKFSKVDSYHEYRSRHRHTPPTKDTTTRDQQANKRVEAVLIQNSSDATDDSSNVSESSSVENIGETSKYARPQKERELSDAERIIIYKILDSKSDKKCKKKDKLMQSILKTINFMDEKKKHNARDLESTKEQEEQTYAGNTTFEHLNEGIYKSVSEKGDNIASMTVMDKPNPESNLHKVYEPGRQHHHCNNRTKEDAHYNKSVNACCINDDTSRPSQSCVGCNCGCAALCKLNNNTSSKGIQPSAATSTSSFKTATHDNANSAGPKDGYVKLIEDGGQEAGKFYIGASGLLKNEAYEVVIQLRKKDGVSDVIDGKSTVDNPLTTEMPKTTSAITHNNVVNEQGPSIPEEDKNGDAVTINNPIKEISSEISRNKAFSSTNIEKSTQESENHTDEVNKVVATLEQDNLPKVFVDKGVHTSFQMSYAIPNHVTKTDPISRPATSTYTQTTLSSPNHRPMFFHMSSSTSTAYMSPPELVLPHFLRKDYHMTDEEKYDTMQVLNRHEYMSERDYSEDHNGCRCKKCTHAKKIIINKVKHPVCCKKHTKQGNKIETPPNTVRTRSSGDTSHKGARSKHGSSTSVKSHNHKHKNHAVTKRPPQNFGPHLSSSAAFSNRKSKLNSEAHTSRPDLNPVLKKYINKLLALNRESLKAIEVADQDCSSVTTPGSSIINVTNNLNKNTPIDTKISFEQIKNMLKQQIIKESQQDNNEAGDNCKRKKISASRPIRKKTVHKVKSLNISKNLQRTKIKIQPKCFSSNVASSSSSSKDISRKNSTESKSNDINKFKTASKQLHTPRPINISITTDMVTNLPFSTHTSESKTNNRDCDKYSNNYTSQKVEHPFQRDANIFPCQRSSLATSSSDTDNFLSQNLQRNIDIPITTSTQTSQNMDAEINLIKLAEDKLQNMEKIADLTEKCTKRLSNLAKVLEEVRKNKSLVYSQISTSDTSESDHKSDKNVPSDRNETNPKEVGAMFDVNKTSRTPSPMITTQAEDSRETNATTDSTDFVPFLNDIPKPSAAKLTESTNFHQPPMSSNPANTQIPFKNMENSTNRARPPTALSRITLKNGNDNIVPHELSTVLEVDSLLSVRLTRENKSDVSEDSTKTIDGSSGKENKKDQSRNLTGKDTNKNPDLLRNNIEVITQQTKISGTESSDDSKLQAIDINQFNGIMLKPFITFQEHAKKCNIAFDEASNLEDIANDVATDDISSLHSDGSLPDVVAELLKRNIISEPFKFDTASNVNSTSISSESAMSVLALSKIRKEKKKPTVSFQNKENIAETSDSLSLSSNPDLEIAFKKLGMGWASSTLKKTKERLALSSSSNTSSSSLSQLKLKSFNQDIPVLVTDSVSSILNVTKRPENRRNIRDISKNVQQQTSLTNSMTVKEFLTNELAKKITFTNKSLKDETGEEFVSLYETKMPEDMKNSELHENHSVESERSGNNRARTSTPVQIFKSMTYHSSSSSNLSNGLFSNADDLSSVKVTSNSNKNHSTSDKDDLTVPNFSLKMKKSVSDCSKSE